MENCEDENEMNIFIDCYQGRRDWGRGHSPQLFEIIKCFEIYCFCQKIFGTLLFIDIKGLNVSGNS